MQSGTTFRARSLALPAMILLCISSSVTTQDAVAQQVIYPGQVVINSPASTKEFAEWRESMTQKRDALVSEGGCFKATFPDSEWEAVSCSVAPEYPVGRAGGFPSHLAKHLGPGPVTSTEPETTAPDSAASADGVRTDTVGNGTAWAAKTTGAYVTSSEGSFPSVTGVTSENDGGTANLYGLQLNSYFFPSNSTACQGARLPSGTSCYQWEQFLYTPEYTNSTQYYVYIQYWLFAVDSTGTFKSVRRCPSGWSNYSGQCYKNSSSVTVPASVQVISNLKNLKLKGSISGGNDTVTLTNGTTLYSVSASDGVTNLASGWNYSEFNLFGAGGGSAATFNAGSSITVKISMNNGSTAAPTCVNYGTTGETNNLNLGTCSGTGGTSPYIQFTESN
jgi:hypothetical protein